MPAKPVQRRHDPEDLGLALEMGRASAFAASVALTDELMTAARGLDLADYDFAVVFD